MPSQHFRQGFESIRRTWPKLVAPMLYVACACIVAIIVWRAPMGVDFTDEAFYSAMSYRFYLGDRPYIDEWSIAQNAAILIKPLVRVYCGGQAPCDGIVLFLRYLYLALAAAIAILTFLAIRGLVPTPIALFAALLPVSFVPYNIFSISYNTIGTAGLSGGCLVGVLVLQHGWRHGWLTLAGVLFALSSFAYPPLMLAAIVAIGTITALSQFRGKAFLSLVAGCLLVCFALSPTLMSAIKSFPDMMMLSDSYRIYSLDPWTKLKDIAEHWRSPSWILTSIVLGSTLLCIRIRKAPLAYVALPMLLLMQWGHHFNDSSRALGAIFFSALASGIWLTVTRPAALLKTQRVILLPCFAGALCMAWASGDGILSCAQALPMVVVYALVVIARTDARLRGAPLLTMAIPIAATHYALICFLLADQAVYRDGLLSRLDTRVPSGPFQGLWTSKERLAYLEEISRLVHKHIPPKGHVFFFYRFPAGYLLSSRRPGNCTVWQVPIGDAPAVYEKCMWKYLDRPITAFQIGPWPHDSLQKSLNQNFRTAEVTREARVFVRDEFETPAIPTLSDQPRRHSGRSHESDRQAAFD